MGGESGTSPGIFSLSVFVLCVEQLTRAVCPLYVVYSSCFLYSHADICPDIFTPQPNKADQHGLGLSRA